MHLEDRGEPPNGPSMTQRNGRRTTIPQRQLSVNDVEPVDMFRSRTAVSGGAIALFDDFYCRTVVWPTARRARCASLALLLSGVTQHVVESRNENANCACASARCNLGRSLPGAKSKTSCSFCRSALGSGDQDESNGRK